MESMPDQAVQSPAIPVTQETTGNPGQWDIRIASKKVAWALAKMAAAQASAPASIAAFQSAVSYLKPYGITVEIDVNVLNKVLPGFIFMILVSVHDYYKVTTKKSWL